MLTLVTGEHAYNPVAVVGKDIRGVHRRLIDTVIAVESGAATVLQPPSPTRPEQRRAPPVLSATPQLVPVPCAGRCPRRYLLAVVGPLWEGWITLTGRRTLCAVSESPSRHGHVARS